MAKFQLEQIRKKLTDKTQLRQLTLDRETVNQEDRTAEFSVSSEAPCESWFGYEILDHSASSIRMDRLNNGAAHRDTHSGDQIGVIDKAWIDAKEKKLRVRVRYSKGARAQEIFQDVQDGIRKNVSIRYYIHALVLEKEVEGVAYYRALDWEPIHTSEEPDPADFEVGHGRSNEEPEETAIPLNISGDKSVADQLKVFNETEGKKRGLKILITNNRSETKI